MFRHKQNQKPLSPSPSDRPPAPMTLNPKIVGQKDSTRTVGATKETMQAAKKMPTPNLSQMIEQRTWENGQLRQELAYQQRKHGASMYLLEEMKLITVSLQQALDNFQRLNTEVDGGASDEVT